MFQPLPVFVGLRYSLAREHSFFVSFITWVSLLGVAVGVAALITVLSVMNGFESELRGRFYDFLPAGARSSDPSWQGTKLAVTYHPAFLLRDPRQKGEAWKDLQMVMKFLGLVPPAKAAE